MPILSRPAVSILACPQFDLVQHDTPGTDDDDDDDDDDDGDNDGDDTKGGTGNSAHDRVHTLTTSEDAFVLSQ